MGLVFVYLTFSLPLSTWLLQGYFRGVPRELEEASIIDGSSQIGAMFRITLPLIRPAVVAVGTFAFVLSWGEFILALALISTAYGYILYFRILGRAGATNASLVTLLVPPSAVLLGFLFLGETLQTADLAGMASRGGVYVEQRAISVEDEDSRSGHDPSRLLVSCR